MPEIKLYNSLSRSKEAFEPLDAGHIRIYACGPTVYNYAHIGNARMAVVFDQLVRVLRIVFPKVTYVSNITDIEDKIIRAAEETGVPIATITKKYTDIYNSDMAALGARLPDIQPLATGHVQDMINLTGALIQRGHAYEEQGHVLFDVPGFENYGRLSGRDREEQIAGARVEVAPYKHDPADFVLWKPSKEDEPGWDSPWGRGRPGWHIECSAMAEHHLGLPFDIHGGGADLKFPHHENEIAQSCCAHGYEDDISAFARYWVHNGFVTVEGEKMSKSLGNVILPHDLLESGERGEVIRLTLLSAHYRQPLDWTEDAIQQSRRQLDRFYQILHDHDADQDAPVPPAFLDALCDDLNTPKALSILNELASKASREKSPQAVGALKTAGEMAGLFGHDPAQWLGYGISSVHLPEESINALLAERQEARENRNFARADEIRDYLAARNILIEDTAEGPKWRLDR